MGYNYDKNSSWTTGANNPYGHYDVGSPAWTAAKNEQWNKSPLNPINAKAPTYAPAPTGQLIDYHTSGNPGGSGVPYEPNFWDRRSAFEKVALVLFGIAGASGAITGVNENLARDEMNPFKTSFRHAADAYTAINAGNPGEEFSWSGLAAKVVVNAIATPLIVTYSAADFAGNTGTSGARAAVAAAEEVRTAWRWVNAPAD